MNMLINYFIIASRAYSQHVLHKARVHTKVQDNAPTTLLRTRLSNPPQLPQEHIVNNVPISPEERVDWTTPLGRTRRSTAATPI